MYKYTQLFPNTPKYNQYNQKYPKYTQICIQALTYGFCCKICFVAIQVLLSGTKNMIRVRYLTNDNSDLDKTQLLKSD